MSWALPPSCLVVGPQWTPKEVLEQHERRKTKKDVDGRILTGEKWTVFWGVCVNPEPCGNPLPSCEFNST
jgi:hypothetical protein